MASYYTIQEAAKRLGITEQKIYYEIERGRLACQEIAGRMVLLEEGFKALKKRLVQQGMLMTPAQYCKKHGMSRSKFDYRKQAGYIKTIKLGGKVFVFGKIYEV